MSINNNFLSDKINLIHKISDALTQANYLHDQADLLIHPDTKEQNKPLAQVLKIGASELEKIASVKLEELKQLYLLDFKEEQCASTPTSPQ